MRPQVAFIWETRRFIPYLGDSRLIREGWRIPMKVLTCKLTYAWLAKWSQAAWQLLINVTGYTFPSIFPFQHFRGASIECRDKDKDTPLLIAADKNHLETIKSLLAHGADISAKDSNDATPIYRAASEGCIESLEVRVWLRFFSLDTAGVSFVICGTGDSYFLLGYCRPIYIKTESFFSIFKKIRVHT